MSRLTRSGRADLNATKNVFLSAMRYSTSVDVSSLSFAVQLKTSAQEQVEYMLVADEDIPLVIADSEVISELETGLSKLLLLFTELLVSFPLESELMSEADENVVLQSLLDIEWMCNMLSKMELMRVFVSSWFNVSRKVLTAIEGGKFDFIMWGVKLKLIEIAGKVSLVSALPSNYQAEILSDWMMKAKQLKFPDLSEAFEVWCYRTKSAKRRLLAGIDNIDDATISL